jgi:hypothetical protein
MMIAVLALMTLGLAGCKSLDSDTTKVSIDISGVLDNLATNSSSSSTSNSPQNSDRISSPEPSDAQTAVKTLLIVPLTFSKHGQPYSFDTFDDDTEEDFEDDAANSANFIKYIQLPTASDTVEIEVPTISEGWQLLSAATVEKVEDSGDIEDATLAYIGFTTQAFKTADGFNKATEAERTLTLKRHCDQSENRPKGCATFDGSKKAIVTSAVEIHRVDINGSEQDEGSNTFPWIVRTALDSNEISADTAESRLDAMATAFGKDSITEITIYVTHQKSASAQARTGCTALKFASGSLAFKEKCTADGAYQENSRSY